MSNEATTAPRLTVGELRRIIADLDDDVPVILTLPGILTENDKAVIEEQDGPGISYGAYSPIVTASYFTSKEMPYNSLFDEQGEPRPGVKPTQVTIDLSDEDSDSLLAARLRAIEDADEDAGLEPELTTGDAKSVIVDVLIPRELHTTIRRLLRDFNASHQVKVEQACTHGPLTVAGALAMLAEDLGMVATRPGSWEGSGMQELLASHGYNRGS